MMAKNQFPMMKTGRGAASKLIGLGVLIVVGVLVVKHPAESAGWVSHAAHGAGVVIDGVADFLRALFGG